MHIPDGMMTGLICPSTAALASTGVVASAFLAHRLKEKPSAARFGAISAFIFAAQMLNFPVQAGTSGHLLGGVLAVSLLGLPFGILSLALVLSIQTLVFADGGFSVLGANVLNISLLGAGLGGLVFESLKRSGINKSLSLGFASWFSVLIAAAACSLELAFSGAAPLSKILSPMLSIHALIGLGEAVLTVTLFHAFSSKPSSSSKWSVAVPMTASLMVAMMLSPFASSFPDGLEWVAHKFQLLNTSTSPVFGLLADYSFPMIAHESISTSVAGLTGVFLTYLLAWGVAAFAMPSMRLFQRRGLKVS